MLKLALESWYSLPVGWRRMLTASPLLLGLAAFLVTFEWPYPAAGAIVSLVLFTLPGPSESEKKGYHF